MNSFELPLVASLLPLAATSVAISISHSDKFVFIVGTGPAKLTRFKTGISVGRWAEVTESRMGTEDVFVVGRANLMEGAPVHGTRYTSAESTPSAQEFQRRSAVGVLQSLNRSGSDSATSRQAR